MTVRYRGILAYDGRDYYGFQRQASDTPTIQGAVEDAIACVTGQRVTLTGAGRTDTGVHATGQVIAFDVAWRHPTGALWRALNATLPDTIALRALAEADADFHPRFDACRRTYEYRLYAAPVRQPLWNGRAWHVATGCPLDLSAMQAAAATVIGERDFATFGRPTQGDNTVREVMCSEFMVTPEHHIRYTIEANAFLNRMVRRIVGALVRVGRGDVSPDEFAAALYAADGAWPNQTAPPCGLCLVNVTYNNV
ncbi:MAG: tRNA pseudouridine(38-40) synthase TruA [Anaerolineae bacterium]|nr:tRNA pseudouridine(38-40) synthase TruA [Anaerolineae bacterium]